MSEATSEQAQVETLELINAEIAARLARQAESGSKIDTKAVALVGYAGAGAAFLAARPGQHILAALAYIAFAAAIGFGVWAYAVYSYQDVPDPRSFFNMYFQQSKAEALVDLAATRAEAFELNAGRYRRKTKRWWFSLASLIAGVILMILSVTSAYWSP